MPGGAYFLLPARMPGPHSSRNSAKTHRTKRQYLPQLPAPASISLPPPGTKVRSIPAEKETSAFYSVVSAGVQIGGANGDNASTALSFIDTVLTTVNSERSTLGAAQSRFEGIVSVLLVARENQSAAASRIMDADYASETASLTRAQILQQAGTAMLAQANALPNNVLSLLRG